MPVVDLITILGIEKTGPMVPAGSQVIRELKSLYDVQVVYTIRRGHFSYSFMELTFNNPRHEQLFRLKYSEYIL